MKYHFRIHKEKKGYWAQCLELPGCSTQGDSMAELRTSMREALNLFLDEPPASNHFHPLPRARLKGRNIIAIPVSPAIAFSTYLRALRHMHSLSQKQAAALLGFKNLYSYQRLESSKSANPVLSTLARIKTIFPEFRLDELLAI